MKNIRNPLSNSPRGLPLRCAACYTFFGIIALGLALNTQAQSRSWPLPADFRFSAPAQKRGVELPLSPPSARSPFGSPSDPFTGRDLVRDSQRNLEQLSDSYAADQERAEKAEKLEEEEEEDTDDSGGGTHGSEQKTEDEEEDKNKIEEVPGVTVNGQKLYKLTTPDGKEHFFYKTYGENAAGAKANFISEATMGADGSVQSLRQTTMNAMLGKEGAMGLKEVGSIQTSNGKLTPMYQSQGGGKLFYDGNDWHNQASGSDSFSLTKGSALPEGVGGGKVSYADMAKGFTTDLDFDIESIEVGNSFSGSNVPVVDLPAEWEIPRAPITGGSIPGTNFSCRNGRCRAN